MLSSYKLHKEGTELCELCGLKFVQCMEFLFVQVNKWNDSIGFLIMILH